MATVGGQLYKTVKVLRTIEGSVLLVGVVLETRHGLARSSKYVVVEGQIAVLFHGIQERPTPNSEPFGRRRKSGCRTFNPGIALGNGLESNQSAVSAIGSQGADPMCHLGVSKHRHEDLLEIGLERLRFLKCIAPNREDNFDSRVVLQLCFELKHCWGR